jgi:signal transduction histidine kinase
MKKLLNEKNIYKISVYSTLIIIILFSISIGYSIYKNYQKFDKQTQELFKDQVVTLKKNNLKSEINNELEKIENSRKYEEKEELNRIKETVSQANNIVITRFVKDGYISRTEIKDYLDATLEFELDQYTDFYIIGENKLGIYLPKLRSMEGRNFSDNYAEHGKYTDFLKLVGHKKKHIETLLDTITDKGGNQRIEKRYFHIQKVSNTSWYIVYEKYIQDLNLYIQEYIVPSLQKSQSDTIHVKGDYIFAHRVYNFDNNDFILEQLVNPNNPDRIGRKILAIQKSDVDGKRYLLEMRDSILNSPTKDAYINYKYLNPETGFDEGKISYWKYLPDNNLLIGKGVYYSDIKKEIDKYMENQKNMTKNNLLILILLLLIFGSISTALAIFTSKIIKSIFDKYKLKVETKNSELHKTIKELNDTQDQLVETEKMAALGQLIAGVSHEINTPLGAIRSSIENISKSLNLTLKSTPQIVRSMSSSQLSAYNQIIEKSIKNEVLLTSKELRKQKRMIISHLEENFKLSDSESIADFLVDMGMYQSLDEIKPILELENGEGIIENIYKISNIKRGTDNIQLATDRASKVVFALKNFSRVEQTKSKILTEITKDIDTVLILYHNQIKRGIEVTKDYAYTDPIFCYPDQLNQVWTNLLHNSIQAVENTATKSIKIKTYLENDFCVISFSDTGVGIPNEIIDKVFNPFFTTKPKGEGTGLGLSIVKKIIERHNGKIDVFSKPNLTEFKVYLPIA